ncbi:MULTISPECIES: PLDc N-terminal domain-containing protein [Enterococcus]|uniref:Cardiolipin synthase N-terminal domain-containing protein n=1 Tax=Enterococcus alcedinis TaxID=1274384 RepID=A0A917JIE0_9ENTE|nr:PLD nuclease N-terminal domain-containing protein [Enterococcus alcedinis]MBP2102661.1 hypothetical protein [Enterococcus alcedinis]GGI66221.1 hypothetical protein GCM10011482_18750 [Enterococcus alcedinis]
MNNTQFFIDNLPLFIPLIVLQMALMVTAVIHVLKHPNYRFGNKALWLIIVIVLQIVGPVIYFVFGRGDSE